MVLRWEYYFVAIRNVSKSFLFNLQSMLIASGLPLTANNSSIFKCGWLSYGVGLFGVNRSAEGAAPPKGSQGRVGCCRYRGMLRLRESGVVARFLPRCAWARRRERGGEAPLLHGGADICLCHPHERDLWMLEESRAKVVPQRLKPLLGRAVNRSGEGAAPPKIKCKTESFRSPLEPRLRRAVNALEELRHPKARKGGYDAVDIAGCCASGRAVWWRGSCLVALGRGD